MHVSIETFWTDGYVHIKIWTKLPPELKKDKNSPPVWEHNFESSSDATWTVGYGPLEKGINDMLEDVKAKMLTEFKNPEFYNSLKLL